MKLEDLSILERDARDEFSNPLPQKHIDGRIIYLARNNYGHVSRLNPPRAAQITDFDLAVYGTTPHSGCIQGDCYRAPEVIVDTGYSYAADIWSLGVLVSDTGVTQGILPG